jgi:hypothetical protein
MISSTLSLSIMVSLSRIISLRSIETTSPVSSSTKSSCHVFNTRAANFLPIYLSPVLETLISQQVKNLKDILVFQTNCTE